MINRGGYKVYPREVEEVLYAHPDVLEAAVIGIPDDRLGEEVVALVVPRAGSSPTPDEPPRLDEGAGRGVQVPASGRRRRRAAEGADGEDPQARDRRDDPVRFVRSVEHGCPVSTSRRPAVRVRRRR